MKQSQATLFLYLYDLINDSPVLIYYKDISISSLNNLIQGKTEMENAEGTVLALAENSWITPPKSNAHHTWI